MSLRNLSKWGDFVKVLRIMFSLVMLIIVIICMPINALALDDGCVSQTTFFNGTDKEVINDYGFNATANYIADSNSGCFYIKIKFIDGIMSPSDTNHFKFTISNSLETISFDVDENGFTPSTSRNIRDKVEVISDFDIRPNNDGGTAIIGFEITEKSYRTLLNNISCDYYCGEKRFVNILSNIALDMYVEETTKLNSTTTKNTITKSTTKSDKKTSATTKTERTTKNSKDTSSTKFTPSKITSRQTTTRSTTGTTKFSPNGVTTQGNAPFQAQAEEDTASVQSDEEYWSEVIEDARTVEFTQLENSSVTQINQRNFKTSNLSKYILALGITAVVVGASVLIVGLVKREKSLKSKGNTAENDNE